MLRHPARALAVVASLLAIATAPAQEPPGEPVSTSTVVATTAPAPEPTGPTLTLEQSVAQALARNFTVRIQRFTTDEAQASVIIAKSVYDPVLGVDWQKAVVQAPTIIATNQGVAAGGPGLRTDDTQTTVSITQNIPTGGTLTGDYNLGKEATNSIYALLNPVYDGNVSLSLVQPLLQGAGIDYALAPIKRAKLGEKIADLTFKSTILTMVFNVETAYYNLIYARQQYNVAKDTLKLAEQLLDENRIKRRTGVLTDLDVVQAQAGVATANSQLIQFKQVMENAADILLEALGEREFHFPLGPVEFPPLPSTDVSFDFSYKLARDNGPNLDIVEATIEQYKLDALRAKRNELPALNVNGGLGYSSDTHSYYSAASREWNGTGYNWSAGVTLTYPWGQRNNRALYRQAKDNVDSEKVIFDQTDQTLVVNVRSAVRSVQANVENVAAANQAELFSQKQYDLQKARFDAGLATSYDVLQAQNLLESSRVSKLQADVNLRIAIADLHMLEGTSLETYHIDLH